MKNKANKGFIREIESKPVNANEKKPFTWSKPITSKPNDLNGMSTPYRLKEFKATKQSKTTLVAEHSTHVKKRRGE